MFSVGLHVLNFEKNPMTLDYFKEICLEKSFEIAHVTITNVGPRSVEPSPLEASR